MKSIKILFASVALVGLQTLVSAQCVQPKSFSTPPRKVAVLPYKVADLESAIRETSGLAWLGKQLVTFNDSGNEPMLYFLDPATGKINSSVAIAAQNKDWEALAINSDKESPEFFLGDFGNNAGDRKDLRIYRFTLDAKKNKVEEAALRALDFSYKNQTAFERTKLTTNYDAEAMVYYEGKLHLFSKEWGSYQTRHYILDPENLAGPIIETEYLDNNYLVTDASIYNNTLYLIGYTKKMEVFLTVIPLLKDTPFFAAERGTKYFLGSSLSLGQVEGIVVNENGMYISSEEFKHPLGKVPPRLYHVPFANMPNN